MQLLRGVIHLVRTHKVMKGSQAEAYAMHTRGEGGGAHTWKYVLLNVPFCTCFVIFSYAGYFYHTLLPLASTFITFFIKHLL